MKSYTSIWATSALVIVNQVSHFGSLLLYILRFYFLVRLSIHGPDDNQTLAMFGCIPMSPFCYIVD